MKRIRKKLDKINFNVWIFTYHTNDTYCFTMPIVYWYKSKRQICEKKRR